jgi:hypothetical protein
LLAPSEKRRLLLQTRQQEESHLVRIAKFQVPAEESCLYLLSRSSSADDDDDDDPSTPPPGSPRAPRVDSLDLRNVIEEHIGEIRLGTGGETKQASPSLRIDVVITPPTLTPTPTTPERWGVPESKHATPSPLSWRKKKRRPPFGCCCCSSSSSSSLDSS